MAVSRKMILKPVNRGPFMNLPAREIELDPKDILCNDVILPGEYNPHNHGLYAIGNEYDALCAVWGPEHKILDIACDENRLESFLIADEDLKEYETGKDSEGYPEYGDLCTLGNASEYHDLTYCWIQEVDLNPALPDNWKLLCAFAEARGANADTLDDIR